MLVEILKEGDNPSAKSPRVGDTCEVTYKGTLRDGTTFDSGTTSFAPNQVIKVRKKRKEMIPFLHKFTPLLSFSNNRVGQKQCN